jgi:hypothetical protein
MKFILIMQCRQSDYDQLSSWPPADLKAQMEFMKRFNRELMARGELVMAEGLVPPTEARVVRAGEDGAPVVSDGPFPEAKEFLAGFWIVDCEGPERAAQIAAQASAAPGLGGAPMRFPIEIRGVGELPPELEV